MWSMQGRTTMWEGYIQSPKMNNPPTCAKAARKHPTRSAAADASWGTGGGGWTSVWGTAAGVDPGQGLERGAGEVGAGGGAETAVGVAPAPARCRGRLLRGKKNQICEGGHRCWRLFRKRSPNKLPTTGQKPKHV